VNEPLADMLRYNAWANQLLLDACLGLDEARLESRAAGTYGSIRETLVHYLSAQDRYLGHLYERGRPAAGWWLEPWPGVARLREHSDASSEALVEAALALDQDAAVTLPPEDGKIFKARKGFLLVQAFSHGVSHRTQVCTILTQIGIEPPDLEAWEWALKTGAYWPA
jgi:uncharacterized damage-inducible protein DinB